MITSEHKEFLWRYVWNAIRVWAWNMFQIALAIAFLFVHSQPAYSLTWSEQLAIAHQPLVFVLENEALAAEAAALNPAVLGVASDGPLTYPRQSSLALEPGALLQVRATAYSSTVDQTDSTPFITAAGTRVRPGVIAANFLPLGTTVRIGGHLYVVEDRLSRQFDGEYVVDIWQPTRAEATAFGSRMITIQLITIAH